MMVNDRARHWA